MKDLTQGSEAKRILLFSLPMLAGNVFQQLYNTVDMYVVGNFIGDDALASIGPTFPVFFLLVSLVMGLGMGISILISQYYGAKAYGKLRAAVDTGYIMMLVCAALLTAIGLAILEPLMRLMQVPEEVLPGSLDYMRPILYGMVFMFGYNALAAILRGLGDSVTPLVALIAATFLNIALDLLFIVVFEMGIAGAAWATVISQALAFVGTAIWLHSRNEYARIRVAGATFDFEIFRKSLRIGLPNAAQQSLVALGMMFLNGLVNPFGKQAMTAFTTAARLDQFAALPAMNISAALSAFTGQNIGAGRIDRVKRGLWTSMAMGVGISVAMGAVMLLFGPGLMDLFADGSEAIAIGTRYLSIVGAAYALFAGMFIVNGAMRGAGAAFVPMITTISALWFVRIPLAFLLVHVYRSGIDGVWFSIPAGWAVGFLVAFGYYASGRWKRRALVKPARPAADGPDAALATSAVAAEELASMPELDA
jgi:putative MATE family efflux protein